LEAGKRYYIEALHKGGKGRNHMSVQWQLPNGAMESPIPGSRLAPYSAASSAGSVRSANVNQLIDNTGAAQGTITATPNPVKTQATVQVNPAETGNATVELYTVQGSLVKTLYKGNLDAGVTKNFTLAANDLNNGVYVLRLTTQTQVLSTKIIVAK
jgi:hypothetical protein